MDDASIFGPDVPSRPFSIDGYFHPQLTDRLNLGLDEDVLNVLCGLCVALILLLLTDIVSRTVVRINERSVNTPALYRATLLSFSTSVLHWFPDAFTLTRRAAAPKPLGTHGPQHDGDSTENDASASSFPSLTKPLSVHLSPPSGSAALSVLVRAKPDDAGCNQPIPSVKQPRARFTQLYVVLAGLSLTAAHFALIFLSTNSNTAVPIDKKRLPALSLLPGLADASLQNDTTRPPPKLLIEPQTICTQHALAAGRAGFKSHASISVCREIEPGVWLQPQLTDTQAMLWLFADRSQLIIDTDTREFKESVRLSSVINVWDGREFKIGSTLSDWRAVATALRAVLARRGFDVVALDAKQPLSPEDEPRDWKLRIKLSFNASMRVPGNVRDTMRTPLYDEVLLNRTNPYSVPVRAVALTRYIAATASSVFDFRGAGAALEDTDFDSLADDDTALVRRERPWLGLVASGAIAAALAVVWTGVALGLRWQAGVEYCARWGDWFVGVSNARDLADVLRETLACDEDGAVRRNRIELP